VLQRPRARMRTSVGEEFGDVDGEEQGDEDVDADDEEKAGEGEAGGIADEGRCRRRGW